MKGNERIHRSSRIRLMMCDVGTNILRGRDSCAQYKQVLTSMMTKEISCREANVGSDLSLGALGMALNKGPFALHIIHECLQWLETGCPFAQKRVQRAAHDVQSHVDVHIAPLNERASIVPDRLVDRVSVQLRE